MTQIQGQMLHHANAQSWAEAHASAASPIHTAALRWDSIATRSGGGNNPNATPTPNETVNVSQ